MFPEGRDGVLAPLALKADPTLLCNRDEARSDFGKGPGGFGLGNWKLALAPETGGYMVNMASSTASSNNTDDRTGKAIALPCGMPGDLPRSGAGGLLSPFCSNMARRFLTALMAVVLRRAPGDLK